MLIYLIKKFNVLLLIVLRSRKNYKAAKQLFIMHYIIIALYSSSFFLWIIRKIYYVHKDFLLCFFVSWISMSLSGRFSLFVIFYFKMILTSFTCFFHVLHSPAFLCVLDDSYFPFLWIEKKNMKNLSLFCML